MSVAASIQPAPGSTWAEEEVKALLALWGEGNVQEQLDGAVRNKTIYENIAQKLNKSGYRRNWEQCRNKKKKI